MIKNDNQRDIIVYVRFLRLLESRFWEPDRDPPMSRFCEPGHDPDRDPPMLRFCVTVREPGRDPDRDAPCRGFAKLIAIHSCRDFAKLVVIYRHRDFAKQVHACRDLILTINKWKMIDFEMILCNIPCNSLLNLSNVFWMSRRRSEQRLALIIDELGEMLRTVLGSLRLRVNGPKRG